MADENASKSAGNADFVQTAYKANVMLRKQLWQLQPFQKFSLILQKQKARNYSVLFYFLTKFLQTYKHFAHKILKMQGFVSENFESKNVFFCKTQPYGCCKRQLTKAIFWVCFVPWDTATACVFF